MRPPQKNRNNRNKNGRHNKPVGNVQNRVYESAGPEGKVRGTPQQIIEKYTLLARDAQTAGDRVTAENFLQHAEHYVRVLNVAQAQMEERRAQEREARGESDGDQDESRANGDARGARDDEDDADDGRGRRDAPRGDRARKADDALATFGGDDDAGPVETPESAARPADRTPSAPEPGGPEPQAGAAPEAAGGEEAAAPPRRRRRRASAATDAAPAETKPAEAAAPASDEIQPG